jgi:hypothetical protein
VLVAHEPFCEKKTESRITVANSAIEAAAITSWPKEVLSSSASFSTAATIPKEMAASMIATSVGASTRFTASKPSAVTSARPSEAAKATPTRRKRRSAVRRNFTSSPAKKKRNTSPSCEKTSSGAVTRTMSRTCGPMRMPATISVTIAGTFGTGSRSTIRGAATAAAIAIARSV